MLGQEQCGNKTTYKHTGRPPGRFPAPQTRPRVATRSQLHRQYATKLPHCCCLHSGEERRPYSVRRLQIRRGGKVPHKACSALAS